MRILVVEDEDSIASFVVKGLTAEGHTVERASSAADGAALGTTFDFDLVLLDLLLPDGNGIDVRGRIRAVRPELPVIIVSALGETDDKVDLLDAGADDYLVKPFAFAELAARVRAATRLAKFAEMQRIILDQAPVVPLYQPIQNSMCSKRVGGFYLSPVTYYRLPDYWIQ